MRFWLIIVSSPARRAGRSSRDRCTSGSVRLATRRRSQETKAYSTSAEAAITNRVGAKPNTVNGGFRGWTQPQVPLWSTPRTPRPRPVADSVAPTPSNRGRGPVRGTSLIARLAISIATTTTTSPANTSRQVRYVVTQPPSSGPTAMPAPASPPMTP